MDHSSSPSRASTTRPPDGTGPIRRRPILRGSLSAAAGLVTLTASAWFTPFPGGQGTTWDRDWKHLAGWKRWLVVQGTVHPSFTDLDMLAGQIGVNLSGGLTGTRSVDITRRYVAAFFDLHLRGKRQTLLDKPSPRYPEVAFCSPPAATCH